MSPMTTQPFSPDSDTLDRYLAGELDPDTAERVAGWIASTPLRATAVAQLRASAHGRDDQHGSNGEQSFELLWQQISEQERSFGSRGLAATLSNGLRQRAWKVGMFVACGTLAAVALRIPLFEDFFSFTQSRHHFERPTSYVTAAGQTASVTLHDGTRVRLAPRTTLILARGFGIDRRDVQLTGEARFEVTNAAGTAFTVRSGPARIRVLGTVFDVAPGASDRTIRIRVQSGKVGILSVSDFGDTHAQSVTLSAGRDGIVTDSIAIAAPEHDSTQYTDWDNRRLVFHGATVSEVLTVMSRWYGYRFRLADSTLATRNVSAVFDYGTPTEAFATLRLLLNVDFHIDGAHVTVVPKQVRPQIAPGRKAVPRRLSTLDSEVGR
jgi:ferric-dicitrate binding protein FerR (iron transport regulator)